MNWHRALKSVVALAAHSLLLCFTLLLAFKIDRVNFVSWWIVFLPLWMFHALVARGRFSLPAPSAPRNRHWAPCHAVIATPLLIAFELLVCIYLETISVHGFAAVNLKIVFLPLLIFEFIILTDNFRMCRALLPEIDESLRDSAIWDILPHFSVAISMVFFIAATVFTLLKLSGDVGALSWWILFINFGIAEFFALLVCTKWSNPVIHKNSSPGEATSYSVIIRYLDWKNCLVASSEKNYQQVTCGLQDIGGHFMKIPVIAFQVLFCMRLEGTPAWARNISPPVLFSPLFVLQGAGILFASSKLVKKIVIRLHGDAGARNYFRFTSRLHDFLGFFHHGFMLLGWWTIDKECLEEQARPYHDGASGYNTIYGYPPEIVKKLPKRDLLEEVWQLQVALNEQTEITKYCQQDYERLRKEVLCRVCCVREVCVVLLPCSHRVVCSACCDRCQECPVCHVSIEERFPEQRDDESIRDEQIAYPRRTFEYLHYIEINP